MDEVNSISRKILLEKVADTEELIKPFVRDVVGLEKLKVSPSFFSFGGVSGAPAASLVGVDEMPLAEKRKWIACRLWAICQRIRQMDDLPQKAGMLLTEYLNWLNNPGTPRALAGAAGGKRKAAYTEDLKALIKEIISTVESDIPSVIKAAVFRKLPGCTGGIIENISHICVDDKDKLAIHWPGDDARRPSREMLLGRDAINKTVAIILKNQM